MNDTSHHDAKIAAMTFSSVYPHYVTKIERKGQSKDDLHTVIKWLTGFDEAELQKHIDGKATFEEFFAEARLNPNASLITGTICGYKIQEITNPLTQKVRFLDKIVDELGQGKKLEKIMRQA